MFRRFTARPMLRATASLRFGSAAVSATDGPTTFPVGPCGQPTVPFNSDGQPNKMDWKTATPEGSTTSQRPLDLLVMVTIMVSGFWWFLFGPGFYDEAPYHK